MKSFVELDKERGGEYLELISATAKLSGLFSSSDVPYMNYRMVENIFCNSFNAVNLSRSDTAFDARIDLTGIGIKTFICGNSNYSIEKIAEFNSLSSQIRNYSGLELAWKLSEYRNNRIELARRLYDLKHSVYHIVARKKGAINLFETDYEKIELKKLNIIKSTGSGLQFEDGRNIYSYNFSKSTLYRKFVLPEGCFSTAIDILDDPYSLLLDFIKNRANGKAKANNAPGIDYVILPLYGIKNGVRHVFEKSGLNQWNAGGRKRDSGEVYIPIPREIHKRFPGFFPERDCPFNLRIPTGEVFSAKVCQDHSKALMTNPNSALSDWILRRVFNVKEGTLINYDNMLELGFDSVIVKKNFAGEFSIDKAKADSYELFMQLSL